MCIFTVACSAASATMVQMCMLISGRPKPCLPLQMCYLRAPCAHVTVHHVVHRRHGIDANGHRRVVVNTRDSTPSLQVKQHTSYMQVVIPCPALTHMK
jgi:hypothetical protein